MENRRRRLVQFAEKSLGCDAVAAFEPENVFYLTGFWGEAIAICTRDSTRFVAPKLEYGRALKDSSDCDVIPTERGSALVSAVVKELQASKRVCADCSDQTMLSLLGEKMDRSKITIDTEPFFAARRIKDEAEVQVISRASRILDNLYELCSDEIKVGVTERDLQAKLVYEGMRLGANPPSYKSTLNPLIIASGPNGALPHAEVSSRKVRKGDFIVVDLTLRHRGYIADATRTFCLGSPTQQMKEVYELVLDAQEAGLKAAMAGKSCGSVDSACRKIIEEGGYGSQFIHSTGHGIGLDVHEPPWIRPNNQEPLAEAMAVTVEPGVYIEGKFGVRIEDSIVVRASGRPHVLNRFTKDLVTI